MDELLTLDALSVQTGVSPRRMREWCATGRLRCERDGSDWVIPTSERGHVSALAATRMGEGDHDHPVALVVPADVAPRNLADEVAYRLGLEPASVAMSTLAIDGQAYVVAVWQDGDEDAGVPKLVELAKEVGGELLDGTASRAEGLDRQAPSDYRTNASGWRRSERTSSTLRNGGTGAEIQDPSGHVRRRPWYPIRAAEPAVLTGRRA